MSENKKEPTSFKEIHEAFNPFDPFMQQSPPVAWMYFDEQMRYEYNKENPQHPIDWGCGLCGTRHYNSLMMITALVMVCDGCYESLG